MVALYQLEKELSSVPDRTRTCNLPLRRRLLYPVGLRELLGNSAGGIRTHNVSYVSDFESDVFRQFHHRAM